MWYVFLPVIWPIIIALDAILLVPLPALLIWKHKPGVAFIVCVIMLIFLIADYLVNFDGITYPFRLLSVPTETAPISIVILIVTGAIAGKKWVERL